MTKQILPDDEEYVKDEYGNYVYINDGSHYFYDDRYIEEYCNNPTGTKVSALKRAGFQGNNTNVKACKMHKRLRSRIEKELDDRILEGAHVGHNVLVDLCKNSESDTVKAKCAKDLIDFAGRKAGERVTVTHEISEEERDSEILRLHAEISEQEGTQKLDS